MKLDATITKCKEMKSRFSSSGRFVLLPFWDDNICGFPLHLGRRGMSATISEFLLKRQINFFNLVIKLVNIPQILVVLY